MTVTFTPATNRYAAIVEAVRTPPPPRPRLHLARISLSVPPLTAKLEVARAAQQAAYMRVYNLAVEAGMGREQLERLLAGEEPGA